MTQRDAVAAVLTVAGVGTVTTGTALVWGSGVAVLVGGALFLALGLLLGLGPSDPTVGVGTSRTPVRLDLVTGDEPHEPPGVTPLPSPRPSVRGSYQHTEVRRQEDDSA